MSSRVGIVLQAIGVIALGSVVYLAFLSPEDPDPLTGIEVENGVRITPPQFTGGPRNGGPEKPKRKRPRRAATLPRLVATPPASEPVVTVPTETPSDSQYEDGVSRIVRMVGRARP